MSLFDFLTTGDNGIGDLVGDVASNAITGDSGFSGGQSAADYMNSLIGGINGGSNPYALGSGLYGTDSSSIGGLLDPITTSMAGNSGDSGLWSTLADAASGSGSNSDTHWYDKVIKNLEDRWNKDPLSMIGTGIGVLSKLNAIRHQLDGSTPSGNSVQPPVFTTGRAEDAFRGAIAPAAINRVAPVPGALSRVGAVQIPVLKR